MDGFDFWEATAMFLYPWNSDVVEKRDGAHYYWSFLPICPSSCLMSINHSQTQTRTLAHTHTHLHTHTHALAHTHTRTHARTHTHTHTLAQPLTFCHIRVFNLRQSTALLTKGRCKTHHSNSLKLSGGFLSTRQHWECCYKYYDL